MKIVIIGATGTIGKAVVQALEDRHTLIKAGFSSGDVQVDMANEASIKTLFDTIGTVDAIISTAGKVTFKPLSEMSTEDYYIGLQHKLMGQVQLVRHGMRYLSEGGVITLTSGVLSMDPIVGGASVAMVNAGIDGFVKSSAIDLPRGIRINAVSPTILSESMPVYGDFFRGFKPVPACDVALAYVKSIEGKQTGQIYSVI